MEANLWKECCSNRKRFKKLFPKESWNKLHLQIIFFGREFCKARYCYGLECDICKNCFQVEEKELLQKNKIIISIKKLNMH